MNPNTINNNQNTDSQGDYDSNYTLTAAKTLISDNLDTTPETSISPYKTKNFKKRIILGALVALFILVFSFGAVYVTNIDKDTLPGDLANNSNQELSKEDQALNKLGQLPLPDNTAIDNLNLNLNYNGDVLRAASFSYGVKYGMGVTRGAYNFYIYPLTHDKQYNPPTDCSMPNVGSYSCRQFSGNNEKLKAYFYDGQADLGIQNTTVKKYLSINGVVEGHIVHIVGADVSEKDMFALLNSFKLKNLDTYKSKVKVNFEPRYSRLANEKRAKTNTTIANLFNEQNNWIKKEFGLVISQELLDGSCGVDVEDCKYVVYVYDEGKTNNPEKTIREFIDKLIDDNWVATYGKDLSSGGEITNTNDIKISNNGTIDGFLIFKKEIIDNTFAVINMGGSDAFNKNGLGYLLEITAYEDSEES